MDATHQTGIEEIQAFHAAHQDEIVARLSDFRRTWSKGTDEDVFAELVFCILTPQSRARTCWLAVQRLQEEGLLIEGAPGRIREELTGVRFNKRKAAYIVEARERFTMNGQIVIRRQIGRLDQARARGWLVKNVKGLGWKEASHFLRNIGRGEDLAILDRHVLRNLVSLGVIEDMPNTLSGKRYLDIEDNMRAFARAAGIPVSHLDLVFWSKETGEIFK